MRHKGVKLILSLVFVLAFLASFFVLADENTKSLESSCRILLEDTDAACKGLSSQQCQTELKKCLDWFEGQSDYYKDKVNVTQKEKKTLQSAVSIFKSKIKRIENEIYKGNLTIKNINLQIDDTQNSIQNTGEQIENSKEKMADLLRLTEEQDKRSLIEVMLAEDELSDFFDELAALEAMSSKSQELLVNIQNLQKNLQNEELSLGLDKRDLEHTVAAQTFQKEQNKKLQISKETLLKETKGKESLYQKYLKENQKKATEIRQKIFQLAQVSEGEAPSYEEAYSMAKYAQGITGVRASLILGLLQVESAIGKNVGQCNCDGRTYCKHPDIGYKEVMRQSQWTSFLKITQELGLDPDKTPISCSVSGGKVQWGGAMGPAQFMPVTWLDSGYKAKIESITKETANPWRVRDAFLAAGLYLKDWGADKGTLQKEIGAVTAYLCGTSRMTSTCKRAGGIWYRNSVIQKASEWDNWIEEGVF